MIRDALEVDSEAAMDRAVDRVVAALVGGPVRSVFAGEALLWAIGHWPGWWLVAAIAERQLCSACWRKEDEGV
jgi:hypothetical protein